MVAVPAPTAVTVTVVPDSATPTVPGAEDVAAYVNASPSGSANNDAAFTVTESPTVKVWSAIDPETTGGRFGSSTVTLPLAVAESPPGSRAVTVMVAVPAPTAVTVTVVPDSATPTVPGAEDIAVYVNASPSGSVNNDAAFTVTDSPTVRVWAAIDPEATGGRFGCGCGNGGPVPLSPPQAPAHTTASSIRGRPTCRRNSLAQDVCESVLVLESFIDAALGNKTVRVFGSRRPPGSRAVTVAVECGRIASLGPA